jgi:hypothetical protein
MFATIVANGKAMCHKVILLAARLIISPKLAEIQFDLALI